MYIISNSKVNVAIKKFVEKDFYYYRNKIQTIADDDKEFMSQFLNRFYVAFSSLFSNQELASRIFIQRLMQIDAVRFNDEDKNVAPLTLAFDALLDYNEGVLEGGLVMPTIGNGVVLLDMDLIRHGKTEWLHTLIHEMVHAMVLIKKENDGKLYYQTGIAQHGKAFFKINEGITEIITKELWKRMYKTRSYHYDERYVDEVVAADLIIEKVMPKEEFIEKFLIDSNEIVKEMKTIVNAEGMSMLDTIELFNKAVFLKYHTKKKFLTEMYKFKSVNCEQNINN